MKRRPVFLHLCRCFGDIDAESLGQWPDWEAVLNLANRHLVTSALWHELSAKGLAAFLPERISEYLSACCEVNEGHNETLKALALDAAATLNRAGVIPAILKGGAWLFDPARPIGWRMMNDLDLLVTEADHDDACAALAAAGWSIVGRAPHAVTLARPGDPAPLDLHRHVGPQKAILSAQDVFASARILGLAGTRLALPSPSHRLVHNILNARILGPGTDLGGAPLNQLLDLAALRDRADWRLVEDILTRQDLSARMRSWIILANRLLNMPYPIAALPGPSERLYLARVMWQMDDFWLGRLSLNWAAANHPISRVRMEYLYAEDYPAASILGWRWRHLRKVLRNRGGRNGPASAAISERCADAP